MRRNRNRHDPTRFEGKRVIDPHDPGHQIPETGRSELFGRHFRLIGVAFTTTPAGMGPTSHVMVSVYKERHAKLMVICLSHPEQPDLQAARDALGETAPGEVIAPFATRQIEGCDQIAVQRIMHESMPEIRFYWA